MSAEEFWKDDPQLFVSYRTSFINKKQKEVEETDYKSWLMGLYIHNGNGILVSSLKQFLGNIVASFSKGSQKDTTELPKYPRVPYCETAKEDKRKEEVAKKQQNYKDYENDLMYFGTLKQQYIEKLSKKKGE